MSSDDWRCEAKGLAPTWAGEISDEAAEMKRRLAVLEQAEREASGVIATLKTKLAMREQQLREADARETAWRKAYVDTFDWFSHMLRDVLGGEYVHGDGASVDDARERGRVLAAEFAKRLRARLGQTPVDTSPEPWEGIVTAAIRWRKGMDRGELARAVDAFTGEYVGPQGSVAIVGGALYLQKLPTSDLAGLAARESAAVYQMPSNPLPERGRCSRCGDEGTLTDAFGWIHDRNGGRRCPVPGVGVLRGEVQDSSFEPVLRPEQYADGAGAQAWRQAMGGKL